MISALREIVSGSGLKPQLIRGGLGNLALRTTFTLLTFGLGVLLARLMGATAYGVYSYILAIIMVLAIPAQFGLPALVVRETAQSLTKKEWGRVRGLWQWGIRNTLFLTAIIAAGAFLFLLISGDRIDHGYQEPLYWGLVLLLLLAFSSLVGAALRGLHKIIYGQLSEQVLVPGFFILFVLAAVFIYSQKISPSLAIRLQALAALCALAICAPLLWLSTPKEIKKARPVFEHKTWLSSLFSLSLISGMQVINKWVSILILGFFVPAAQIGIYRVAVQMAVLADFGLQVINPVIAPQIARLYTMGDVKRLQSLATQSARVVLFFNLIITVGFILFGRQFIRIFYGPEFSSSYYVLLILLVGGLVNSFVGSVGYLLNMTGHERETLQSRVVATLSFIVLALLLSPLLGIYGAAISSSVSLIVWNVLLWRLVRKLLNINSLAFGRNVTS